MQKAKRGEVKAVNLLEKNGYDVVDIQKEGSYTLVIDDKPRKATVKADMIVKKGNKIYVAEVKTGDKVTSPLYSDTRRQLLEYYLVYKPHGLILVDMEREKIRSVKYSFLQQDTASIVQRISWLVVLFFAGFVIGFLTRGG